MILVIIGGLLAGLLAVELFLSQGHFRPFNVVSADPDRRTHYVYVDTGVGKCFPSDPRSYFRYDLRAPTGFQELGTRIGDVSDLPDNWSMERRIQHLRKHAPFCNVIDLPRLNRGPDLAKRRQAMIIGDSFAFGEGLRLEDTIGYRLNHYVPDVNFANMSWPGSSIETLLDVSLPLENIETVIYFYNINDIALTDELDRRGSRLHAPTRRTDVSKASANGLPLLGFCKHLKLCRFLRNRSFNRQQSDESVVYYHDLYFSGQNEEPRARSFRKLGQIKADVSRQGIRFVVVMFPFFYKAPFSDYPFRRIHDLVAHVAHRHGIELIDLLQAYDEHRWWEKFTIHPIDRHPSAKAIDVAARYLKDKLNF